MGVNFEWLDDGRLKLSQPHLIDQVIEEVGLHEKGAIRQTPAVSGQVLHRDIKAPKFNGSFHYRRVIGKLNFLSKSTRPDIEYAVHQCARFCEDPRKSHGDAIVHLAKYLKGTRDKGLIFDPKKDESLRVYADADFAGNWFPPTAPVDPSTAKSRSGYVILFAGCPLIWASKLQTFIALSTTEAEYMSLSQSLRDTIPVMSLLEELKKRGFSTYSSTPYVYCKAFEDNSGALELARAPKLQPRTKHINQVFHHFREHVCQGLIHIYPVSTDDQLADMLTKPLPQNVFVLHRNRLMKW